MYLTAQRVRRPNGQEGINAYYYWNRVDVWAPQTRPPLIPDHDPGELVHQITTVDPPGGNRVRSYLDIVAQDFTPAGTVRRSFAMIASGYHPQSLPFAAELPGLCWIRFGAEHALAAVWRQELRLLFEWAILAYQQTFEPPPPAPPPRFG